MEEQSRNQTIIKKLESLLKKPMGQQEEIDTLATLAWELRISHPERSMEHARKTVKMAKSGNFQDSPYQEGTAAGLTALAFVYLQLGELNEGTRYCLQALKILPELPQSAITAHIWLTLAQNSAFLGDYSATKSHAEKALAIANTLELPIERAWALDMLAIVHAMQENFDDALDYHHRSIEIFMQENDIDGGLRAQNNLAMTFYKQEAYDQARRQIVKTLEQAKIWNQKFDLLNMSCTAAQIAIDMYRFEEAEEYLNAAFANAEVLENTRAFHIFVIMEWARLSLKLKETVKAKSYFMQALVLAEENDQIAELAQCYQELSFMYSLEGDTPKATKYTELAQHFRDELKEKHAQHRQKIQAALKP